MSNLQFLLVLMFQVWNCYRGKWLYQEPYHAWQIELNIVLCGAHLEQTEAVAGHGWEAECSKMRLDLLYPMSNCSIDSESEGEVMLRDVIRFQLWVEIGVSAVLKNELFTLFVVSTVRCEHCERANSEHVCSQLGGPWVPV